MKREYTDFLRDMLENAQRAIQFTKGMSYEVFAKDDKTVYAVIRAVEIIGEAAANIPEEVCAEYSNVPWREVKGMRNKLVHQYFGINMEVVWQTIQEDLPMLIEALKNA
ncbi:MAG: DUF86 domain-containing protein [Anaerolineales bacterium]